MSWKNQYHFCDQCNHSFNLKCFYEIPLTWWKTYRLPTVYSVHLSNQPKYLGYFEKALIMRPLSMPLTLEIYTFRISPLYWLFQGLFLSILKKEVFFNFLAFLAFLSACRAILRFMSHKERKQREEVLSNGVKIFLKEQLIGPLTCIYQTVLTTDYGHPMKAEIKDIWKFGPMWQTKICFRRT